MNFSSLSSIGQNYLKPSPRTVRNTPEFNSSPPVTATARVFAGLDRNKVMYFKNSEGVVAQSFGEALDNLARVIGCGVSETPARIEQALYGYAMELCGQAQAINPDHGRIVAALHHWAMNIHDDSKLTKAPSASANSWPANVIFELLNGVRSETPAPCASDRLLRFFLEGANARKISKGQTPSTDFISTTLLVETICALEQENQVYLKGLTGDFNRDMAKYVKVQNHLEHKLGELAKPEIDPLFAELSQKKVFYFGKTTNLSTTANAYDLEVAIANGVKIAQGSTPEQLATMVKNLKLLGSSLLAEYQDLMAGDNNNFAKELALWDASEYLMRVYVGLKVAEQVDPEAFGGAARIFDDLTDNAIFPDLLRRSLAGDFPVKKERAALLETVGLVKLFTRDEM